MAEPQAVRATRDSGFFADGRTEDCICEWLIDTGCRPQLDEYEGTLLSADDSPIKVHGWAEMNIKKGNKLMRHMVLVNDIANEGLIGTGFLRANQMIIDFAAIRVMLMETVS